MQQQTQKLQELGTSSSTSKNVMSPMQENPSLGPMEETRLDFENLVLGKKSSTISNNTSTHTSPPMTAFQTFNNISRPTTPMNIMTPIQPTSQTSTPPPPFPSSSHTFFQPFQSSPNTASSQSSSATAPRTDLFTSTPSSNTAFSASIPVTGSGFSANNNIKWPNSSSLNSFPTIAPPPAKPNNHHLNIGFTPQQAKPADGLEKYQSLL